MKREGWEVVDKYVSLVKMRSESVFTPWLLEGVAYHLNEQSC